MIRAYQACDYEQVKDVFWETSTRREFASAEERQQFQRQYLDDYLTQLAFVAVEDELVLGYVVGQLDTLSTELSWPPHLNIFRAEYARFPGHLHINCRAESQGKGLGSQLLHVLESAMQSHSVKALHLLTAVGSRNVNFYKKCGYEEVCIKQWKAAQLIMLGKVL